MRGLFKRIIVFLLTWEAKLVLHKYKPRIIAVTGSVGKTSTKDAIYSVLAPHVHVRKSDKSFNSEVGIPLTILGRPNAWQNPLKWVENLIDGLVLLLWGAKYPAWLVLEVGADRPGDISSVAKWLKCDMVIITRLPDVPVHVEFFRSPEDVVREKASLLTALKSDGTFIANADDAKVLALREHVPGRSVTYGFTLGSDIMGEKLELLTESGENGHPLGLAARVKYEDTGESVDVRLLGTIGSHGFMPMLAAIAVGKVLDIPLASMAESLAAHVAPPGRMRLIPGIKGTLIIDDTYNASPAATSAALHALGLAGKGGRRIAILGDMLELGRYSTAQHREVGKDVADCADILLTVGFRARDIAQGALDSGMKDERILQYEDAKQAGNELEQILEAGDVVLIKGSQSMRMERIVEEVMAEPHRAKELLVRQEREWRRR